MTERTFSFVAGPSGPWRVTRLTWFEYAPQDAPAFQRLVAELRESPEWD